MFYKHRASCTHDLMCTIRVLMTSGCGRGGHIHWIIQDTRINVEHYYDY